MATITTPFYKIGYQILTNGTNTDPPSVVGPLTFIVATAASLTAAVAALIADLSLAGNQRCAIVMTQQIHAESPMLVDE